MSVASTAITTPTPLAVVSTRARNEAWWAEQSAKDDTDWPGVVNAALEMMVAGGILESEPDTVNSWDVPSWRQAAVEYHRDRPGRLAGEIDPTRLALLRRLMVPDISLERAWHELRDMRPNFRKAISDDRWPAREQHSQEIQGNVRQGWCCSRGRRRASSKRP
jgi:hypothetical protein